MYSVSFALLVGTSGALRTPHHYRSPTAHDAGVNSDISQGRTVVMVVPLDRVAKQTTCTYRYLHRCYCAYHARRRFVLLRAPQIFPWTIPVQLFLYHGCRHCHINSFSVSF